MTLFVGAWTWMGQGERDALEKRNEKEKSKTI